MKLAITLAAAAALIAGCGGTAAAVPGTQHAAASGNTRVCEHFRTQRNFVLNDATPNLAAAVKIESWIAVDQAQATPGSPLARDLNTMLHAMQSTQGSDYTASRQVLRDCQALGVTF